MVAGSLVAGMALAGFSAFWWGRRRGRKEAGPKSKPAISEQELQQHVPARSGYQHQQYPPQGERVDSATPGSGPLPNPFVCDHEQDASYVNRTSSPLIATPVQFVEVEAEADRYQVQYPIMRSTPELQGIAGPGQDGAELPQGHARSELPLDGERTELPYGCNRAELPTTPKWRP